MQVNEVRTADVLKGAVSRLRRLSRKRSTPETKAAYRTAADIILKVMPRQRKAKSSTSTH